MLSDKNCVEVEVARMTMQDLRRVNDADKLTTLLPVWIKDKVIPAYTVASVNYFQSLPGRLGCAHFCVTVNDMSLAWLTSK